METRITRQTLIAGALILAGITMRLVPHVANFAPVGAIALFGGAVLKPKLAWWLPLAIMISSDLIIGTYSGIAFTWAGFLLVAILGISLRKANWLRVPFGALGASAIFYLVSNFGVWVSSGMYAHSWQGLQECYIAALPFFRTTIASDLVFSAVLFGAYAMAAHTAKQPATEQA